jgi:hypothetical protein
VPPQVGCGLSRSARTNSYGLIIWEYEVQWPEVRQNRRAVINWYEGSRVGRHLTAAGLGIAAERRTGILCIPGPIWLRTGSCHVPSSERRLHLLFRPFPILVPITRYPPRMRA